MGRENDGLVTPPTIINAHYHMYHHFTLPLSQMSPSHPLFIASYTGRTDIISLLLKANASPNLQHDEGTTPLYIASQEGHTDVISLLLKANANPNLQYGNGRTPLMIAALNDRSQIVQLLLASGADPNLQHSSDITALMLACRAGCLESVELLLMSGADPRIKSEGLTALDMAANRGHEDIVDLLQAIELSQSTTTTITQCLFRGSTRLMRIAGTIGADDNVRHGPSIELSSTCLSWSPSLSRASAEYVQLPEDHPGVSRVHLKHWTGVRGLILQTYGLWLTRDS